MVILTHMFKGQKEYASLLDVLSKSAQEHMPGISIDVLVTSNPRFNNVPMVTKKDEHHYRTAKAFIDLAEKVLKQKEIVAVCDADLMFLRPIDDYPELYSDADIGITVKEYKSHLNTGIWFYRPTEAGQHFVRHWISHTKHFLKKFRQGKRKEVNLSAGIDQAALQICLEANNTASIAELPCLEWNATQSEWGSINPKTRVVHIKSHFRELVMERSPMTEKYAFLEKHVNKWKEYHERELDT